MRPFLYVAALALLSLVAVWAYRINYETLAAEDRVERLEALIAAERQAIEVLRAEWAWLNRPQRLRDLAEAHADALGLEPMTPASFGAVAMVSFQPPPPHPPAPPPGHLPAPDISRDLAPAALPGDAPARPAPPLAVQTPPSPDAPEEGAAEAPVLLAALAGTDHIALGMPLPPPRPLSP